LLGEVIEVARTQPRGSVTLEAEAPKVQPDDDDEPAEPSFGENVSGIPLGAQVLFGKDRGLTVPWDDSLRLLEVRHVVAIVEQVSSEDIQ
jgi:hypothetical protein